MMVKTKKNNLICFTDGKIIFLYNYKNGKKIKDLKVKGCKEFICMYLYEPEKQKDIYYIILSDISKKLILLKN